MQRSLFYLFQSFFLILISLTSSLGQIVDTLYFNQYWQLVATDSGSYRRIAEIDTINLWYTGKFRDILKDGTTLTEGQYSKSGLKNGLFISYYLDGTIYRSGVFDNGKLSGIWNFYYQNGQLMEKIKFTEFDFQIIDAYDSDGGQTVKNGTGKWQKKYPAPDGTSMRVTGRYYNNRREGNWTLLNSEGKPILIERYSNDYFIMGKIMEDPPVYYNDSRFTNEMFYPESLRIIESFTVWAATTSDYSYLSWLPNEASQSRSEEIELVVPDTPAHYPLGMEAFYKKVSQILVYPKEARIHKIEGKVFIEFYVGSDGNLYDIHVLKGIGGGCDQQAVIAILEAGRWFPAQKNGFPVEQKMVIPVSFRLKQ